MKWTSAAYVLAHVLNWRYHWGRFDANFAYTLPDNPKFMPALDAVKLLRDGDVVAVSGLAANQWVSVLYYTLRNLYNTTGTPKNLTLMAIGGIGARGKAPGSIEEIGLPGLCSRFFAGHLETYKSILRLGDKAQCEIQCLPQGCMAYLLEGQGRGEDSLLTRTGVGTFMDPRVGRGTPVTPRNAPQYVQVEGEQLRYTLPKVTAAMWNAPAADRDGNIYIRRASMIAEIPEITRAAKYNGGHVIANVGSVVEKGYGDIFIPADRVDAIVVHPETEQAGSVKHRKYWPMFTTESDIPASEGVQQLKFVNELIGMTPRRTRMENALARLAASIFAQHGCKQSLVNIGVGLPEEVCRLICESGLERDVTFFSESGVIGGLPAPGVFFGAAVSPQKMLSSAETFHMCYDHLDISILGALQVDSAGNVNVSKRGEGAINYVGPGGFIDFTTAARTIIFVTSWMHGGRLRFDGKKVRIVKKGKPKFVEKVDEITFSGAGALAAGKKVFYVTNVGVFQLTEDGMAPICIMPGIDLQRDILQYAPMRIVVPDGNEIPVAPDNIVTGKGFKISLREKAAGLAKKAASV